MNSSKRATVGVAVVSLLLPAIASVGLFGSVAGAAGTNYGGGTTVAGPGGVSLPITKVFKLSPNALRGQVTVDGCSVTVNVPRGTFPSGDELIVANASRITPPAGTKTVVSFFIGAYRYGARVTSTFRHSVTAVALCPKIKVGDRVYASTGGGWNLVRSASVTNGRAAVAITSDRTIDVAGAINSSEPTISYGARGATVKLAQTLLNQAGARLTVDGIFGANTEAAVRAFQSRHGLAVDGVVGAVTWNALRS